MSPLPGLAPLAVGAAALAGAAVGAATAGRLRTGGYRLEDETGPLPRLWWWPAPALAAAWAWSTWLLAGAGAPVAALPPLLLLGWLAVALAWIDLDVHRLPDGLVYPAYPAAAVLLLLATAADPVGGHLWALYGGAGMLLAYGLVAVAVPAWMGLGDVKVAGLVGLVLGWWGPGTLVLGVLASILLGGVQAAAVLVTRRGTRRSEIAYGPALLAGGLLAAGSGFQILTAATGG